LPDKVKDKRICPEGGSATAFTVVALAIAPFGTVIQPRNKSTKLYRPASRDPVF